MCDVTYLACDIGVPQLGYNAIGDGFIHMLRMCSKLDIGVPQLGVMPFIGNGIAHVENVPQLDIGVPQLGCNIILPRHYPTLMSSWGTPKSTLYS